MSLREKMIREELDKTFGDRETAKEIKEALLLSKLGQLTDEKIEEYRKRKEKDLEELRKQFNELNPSYAFEVQHTEMSSKPIDDDPNNVIEMTEKISNGNIEQ